MTPIATDLPVRTAMTRRRFINILAATGAASLIPQALRAAEPETFTWEGIALGANARLTLQHSDETFAKAAIEACLSEVSRLETIFSLYRRDSTLSRLNRFGGIDDAPAELRELLSEAFALARLSEGAFDPTIQPLWRLYADHFAAADAVPEGPSPDRVAAALRLVDWRAVRIEGASISFGRPGMAITLNGIAQGYITDRVGDLLRERGFAHVLANMGEELALGPKWDGSAWRVGIADPREPSSMLTELALRSGAMATSGGYGYRFDSAGRFTHILDPKTGDSARRWASVTVLAENATLADGLSTALSIVPNEIAARLLRDGMRAYVVPFGSTPFWI